MLEGLDILEVLESLEISSLCLSERWASVAAGYGSFFRAASIHVSIVWTPKKLDNGGVYAIHNYRKARLSSA